MAGRLKKGIAGMVNCRGAGGRPASDALRFMSESLRSGTVWGVLVFGMMPIVNASVGTPLPVRVPPNWPIVAAYKQEVALA